MKTSCKYIVSCFLFICTFLTFPTFVKAHNYKHIWSNSYFTSSADTIFSFMGPKSVYYNGEYRYFIPFIVLYDGKMIYKGIAEAPIKMTTKNSLERLCEESQIDMDMKGAEKAKELCEKRKTMEEYQVDEVLETQLYPTFLVPEALMAQDKYFTFNITLGSESGDNNAYNQHDMLEIELAPGAENVPPWVHQVLGTFASGFG